MTPVPLAALASPAPTAPGPALSVDAARSLILDRISPVDVEDIALVDAGGRVLGADRKAMRPIPAFDNSAMDGVGVRTADVTGASRASPVALRVVGEALPGAVPPFASATNDASATHDAREHTNAREHTGLREGECVRIMTGAPVPPGVDAVVMREVTDESRVAEGIIAVLEPAPLGQHVRRRGEDVQEGELIVRAGDVVTPARMNAALCAGIVRLMVHRRPVVAILASGDELREIGAGDEPGTIPNSNAHAIAAVARAAGCDVRLLGIASDSLDDHVDKMRAGLDADALVTIGGVSMGTHDFVRPALEKLGGTLEMWRVAMRPGKPIAFGRIARADRISLPIFGLPGNPVSAHVAGELFLRPALEKLGGARALVRPLWSAVLVGESGTPFTKKSGLEHWARGEASLVDGRLHVRVLDKQGSHHIAALARANALVRFAIDVERVDAGALVEVLLLDEPTSGRPRTPL